MDASGWDVRRTGGTVSVNSPGPSIYQQHADAIVAATDELLRDGEVSIVEVTGPIDAAGPPDGLARAPKPYVVFRTGGTAS